MAAPAPKFTVPATMPRPLHDGRTSPRREEVLDGLEHRILHDGFRSLRLTNVAKDLGTSYATLYQLAATKDELVLLVVDRFFHRAAVSGTQELEAVGDPIGRLKLWTSYGTAGVGATTPQFWADVESHAGIGERVAAYRHYYVEVLQAIIEDGIARGAFRDVDAQLLALTWEAASARLADFDVLGTGRTLQEAAEGFVDIVLFGLVRT